VRRYGVELDAERALIAQSKGIETIQGNAFDAIAKPEVLFAALSESALRLRNWSGCEQPHGTAVFSLTRIAGWQWMACCDGHSLERLMDCAGLLSSHFTVLNVFA